MILECKTKTSDRDMQILKCFFLHLFADYKTLGFRFSLGERME